MNTVTNNRKKDYIYCAIIIVLIAVILMLVSCSKLGKINNKLNPTGNVEVFNIGINCINIDPDEKCGEKDTSDKDNKDNSNNGNKSYKNNTNYPIYNPDTDEGELGQVFVDDINGSFIYQSNLDIFNNVAFDYTNKIAPGTSNSYDFKVHNQNTMTVKYKIKMTEESAYKVNLKYRLSKNGSYVIGNETSWVTADKLVTSMATLEASSDDEYRLDWKWFDSSNDTEVGEKMTSAYKLKLRFDFESVS